MAFTVQPIEDGFRNYIIKVDGAGGDTVTTLVNPTLLDPPCTRVRLKKVTYSLAPAGDLQLLWDATTDIPIVNLFGGSDSKMNFCPTAGIPNNAGVGVTGNVNLSATATTAYTLYLEFIKSDPINPM